MGYNTRPELVELHAEVLEMILTRISAGQSLELHCERDQISKSRWNLRQVLAATDHFKAVCGGRYAGLGSRVLTEADYDREKIIIKPKGGVASLKPVVATELDALRLLNETKGSMALLEFHPSPSFNELQLIAQAKEIGWTVHPSTKIESEDGKLTYAAEKETASELDEILSEFRKERKGG